MRPIRLIRRLILHLARQWKAASLQRLSPGAARRLEDLRQLRHELQERFAQPWTLEEMTRRVHLGASRFLRLYREFFGVTPVQDLIEFRIQAARRMLDTGAATVGEVAEACGFGSLQHFSRFFKRRVGHAPSQYRQTLASRAW